MRSGLIILGIIACLFASGCKQDAWKNLNKAEAALWMLKDSSDQVAYWYLCHLYDPYQGGKVIPADSASRKILEIHRDGRFVIQNRESQLEGRWKLNQARTEILFISKARNGGQAKTARSSIPSNIPTS